MNFPNFLVINPTAHYMQEGAVAFIPGWIWLEIIVITIALLYPKLFSKDKKQKYSIINPYFLAFLIGSLMPAFDDLLAFVLGEPFAHHSLFHSLIGSVITYAIFWIISNKDFAKYALFGNLTHTFFNFYLDYVTLFFPLTYQEFGLTDITNISTYWLKVIHYPIILILFIYAIFKTFQKAAQEEKP